MLKVYAQYAVLFPAKLSKCVNFAQLVQSGPQMSLRGSSKFFAIVAVMFVDH